MFEYVSNFIGWVAGWSQEEKFLEGPTFIRNKKENRLRWINLDGELSDIPSEEFALHLWSDHVLKQNPNESNALYIKAYLLYRQGKYPSALEMINYALVFKPNNPWCVLLKGDILFSLKDFYSANRCYSRVWGKGFASLLGMQGEAIHALKDEFSRLFKTYVEKINSDISAKKVSTRQTSVVYYQRGELFFALEEYEKAQEAFENALKIDPEDPYAKRRADESRNALNQPSASSWVRKCYLCMEKQNYSEALVCIGEALRIDAINIENLFLKFILLNQENKIVPALMSLRQITYIQPQHKEAWYETAVLLRELNLEREAREAAYQAFSLDPNFTPAFRIIIELEYKLQGFAKTLGIIQNLLKLQTQSIGTLVNKTEEFLKDIRILEAFACLAEIERREPQHLDVLFMKGCLLAAQGKFQEALKCVETANDKYDMALQQNPRNLVALQGKAFWYFCSGEKKKASQMLERVDKLMRVGRKPLEGKVYCQRGMFFFALKKYELAQQAFEKSVALYPKDLFSRHCLAKIAPLMDFFESSPRAEIKKISSPCEFTHLRFSP